MGIKIDERTKLDAIVLNNVAIVRINEEKLKKQQVLFTSKKDENEPKKCYVTNNGEHFQYLRITDVGCITQLVAGVNNYCTYCKVQLNVKRDGIGNLIGYTVNEYWEEICFSKKILWDIFGVLIDFSNAKIQEIEINRTFKTFYPFYEYDRPIELVLKNIPKMKLYSRTENSDGKIETKTAYSSKNKKSYKETMFYNKKQQINYRIVLDDEIMRFEIKLVGNRNIERNFKCEFSELTQEMIEDWFLKQIEKLIVKPLKKWKKEQRKILTTIVQEEYKKGGLWQISILERLQDLECKQKKPLLLDVEELYPIIDMMNIGHKSQIKKRMRKRAESYHTIFIKNDLSKLEEILQKLS